MKSVAVVTVTNGSRMQELNNCVDHIVMQTYPVMHYILCDGDFETFLMLREWFETPTRRVCYWDGFIGGKGLEGRKWLAASAMLVNEEVTFFCNDDDWYKPNHVETIMEQINKGYDWAYSLRSIYDKEGSYLFDDNCEALGEYHHAFNTDNQHFVDWCMWGMKTDVLKQLAVILAQKGYGIDRVFYNNARNLFPKFIGTGKHTFCFRLGGNEYSVIKEFFEIGNLQILKKFNNKIPWITT